MLNVAQAYIPLNRKNNLKSPENNSKIPLDVAAKCYCLDDSNQRQSNQSTVTAIFLHGTGFPKELYEPIIEDTLNSCLDQAWTYDAVTMGQSYRINQNRLPEEVSYEDFANHLIQIVEWIKAQNAVEEQQRYILIGHSFGGAIALYALELGLKVDGALIIEPVIAHPLEPVPDWVDGLIISTKNRTFTWANRSEACDFFNRQPLYAEWDPNVLQRFLTYGIEDRNGQVALVTPKEHELYIYQGDKKSPSKIYSNLKHITVPLAFVGGKDSLICRPLKLVEMANQCAKPFVQVIANSGHLLPFTHPPQTAQAIAAFVRQTIP